MDWRGDHCQSADGGILSPLAEHGLTVRVLTINNVERESYKFLMAQKEAQPTKTDWRRLSDTH